MLGHVHVVDCRPEEPKDYVFRLFGTNVTMFGQQDFTRKRVGNLPDAEWAQETANDYQRVAQTGCPTFHKIALQHNWLTRKYTRLILPFRRQGTADQPPDGVPQRAAVAGARPPSQLSINAGVRSRSMMAARRMRPSHNPPSSG